MSDKGTSVWLAFPAISLFTFPKGLGGWEPEQLTWGCIGNKMSSAVGVFSGPPEGCADVQAPGRGSRSATPSRTHRSVASQPSGQWRCSYGSVGTPHPPHAVPTAQQVQQGLAADGLLACGGSEPLFLFRSWKLRAEDERRPALQGDRVLATALEHSLLSLEALSPAVALDLLPRMQQSGRGVQVTSQLWVLGWVSPGGKEGEFFFFEI